MKKSLSNLIRSLFTTSIFLISFGGQALNIQTVTTGNWSDGSTWAAVNRTGSITCLLISSTVSGSGTSFTTELVPGSILRTSGGTYIGTVQSITSNTSLTLTANAAVLITLGSAFKAQIVPSATDDATIVAGDVVTVTGSGTINSITFDNSSSSTGELIINSGMVLTVTAGITLQNRATGNTSAIISGDGTLNCASLAIGSNTTPTTAATTYTHQFTSSVSTFTISGDLTVRSLTGSDAGRIANGSFLFSSGTVTVGGSVASTNGNAVNNSTVSMATGSQAGTLILTNNTAYNFSATGTNSITLNGSSATVNYNGSGSQTIAAYNYTNLISSNSGSRILANSGTIGIAGAFTPGTNSYTITSSTINFNGSGSQTIPAFNYNNLTSSNSGGRTLAGSGTIGLTGTFTPGSNSYTITGSTIDFNGSATQTIPAFNYNNLASSNAGNRTLANAGTIGIAATFTKGTNSYTVTNSTIDFNGAGGQNIPAFTFNNLTTSNANTKSAAGTLTVNGTLNITSGITLDMGTSLLNGSLAAINGTGNLKTQNTTSTPVPVSKTWTCTVFYNSAVAQTIVHGNYSSLDGSGGSRTLSFLGVIRISSVFTPGTGSYTISSSTIDFNGSGVQTIPAFNYNNLTSSNTGSRTLASSGTIGIATTFTPGTNSYTVIGSTINFNGAGAQNLPAFTYNNLTTSNVNTKSAAGTLAVDGILTIAPGIILDMGPYDLSGSLSAVSGTGYLITQNNSTTPIPVSKTWTCDVFYYSSSPQTVVNGNYTNLDGSGGDRTLSATGTIGISSAFTPGGGIYTITGSTIDYNGSGAQTIEAFTYNNLKVSGGNTKTMGGDATIVDSLKIAASTTLELDSRIITLRSDAVKTARVAMVEGAITYVGGGKFEVQRYIPTNRAWRLMTSPLSATGSIYDNWQNAGVYQVGKNTLITGPSPSGVNGLDVSAQNNFSMKTWNTSTQLLVGVSNTKANNLSANSGSADNKAYFIFIRGDRNPENTNISDSNLTTLSSAGRLQVSTQVLPACATAGGYTLIGNPYASPIDFNSISRTNLVKRFYVWDPALNQVGAYIMLDDIDGDGIYSKSAPTVQDENIQSGQAFFVQTMITAPASVTFNESSKSAVNNGNAFRPIGSGQKILRTNLYLLNTDNSNRLADGNFVEFDKHYKDQVNTEDAIKFGNANESIALLRYGATLVAERRPLLSTKDTLFFKLTKTTQRNYQFEFIPENLDYPGMMALLEDNFTGATTSVSLTGVTKINFSVTANNASAASNRFRIVFRPIAVVPVTFSSIKAYEGNKNIAVDWHVENEINIISYEVERSADGVQFSVIHDKKASHDNVGNSYTSLDMFPKYGINYYRVKSIELNGEVRYSQVVKVEYNGKNEAGIIVYPNPVVDKKIRLELNAQPKGRYDLRLINEQGQVLMNRAFTNISGTEIISLPANIAKGIYQLEIIKPGGTKVVTQLLY